MNYTVQPGDNLWSIASRHGVSMQEIIAANPGINPQKLYVGQNIVIPRDPSPAVSGPPPSYPYGPGDWNVRISRLEKSFQQAEDILNQHRRQIADIQRRITAIERRLQ